MQQMPKLALIFGVGEDFNPSTEGLSRGHFPPTDPYL